MINNLNDSYLLKPDILVFCLIKIRYDNKDYEIKSDEKFFIIVLQVSFLAILG